MAPSPASRPIQQFLKALTAPHDRGATSAAGERVVATCRTLLSERGEVSGMRLAEEALTAYQALDAEGRDAFFNGLLRDFSPNPEIVYQAAAAYRADSSPRNLIRLQAVVEPPRQELFRRLNFAPGGTLALVGMRRQLVGTLEAHPERESVDADLLHLFRSWFNRGFLVLQRIDWRSSAVVLERLIQYEAVHQIQGWRDLRRRLEADRRCYAFFHQAFPDAPLIFIEVALTRGLSTTIQPLLDATSAITNPDTADCATFYSITSCQEGLQGVSFGNSLIKQVVADLGREFPRLRTFGSLSPIPTFRQWLLQIAEPASLPLSAQARERVTKLNASTVAGVPNDIQQELMALCARFLLTVKRGRAPFDPVARFHLSNGARLDRLNWLADTSPQGIERSFGIMANYLYRLDDLERNHEAYATKNVVIASRALKRFIRGRA